MKRNHGHVSSTPLFLLKKGRKALDGLGTPVEGLTGMPVDTPDSEDRPQRAFPETTQRRLEGFCLSTPLSLSQQALQETPTLVKDQPAQHEDPVQQQQQQPTQPRHGSRRSSLKQQQQPQHLGPAGLQTATQGRHRLANISNLPPSPAPGAGTFGSPQEQQPDSIGYGPAQPMATGNTTGRSKPGQHMFFQPGVLSPQASLLAPASGPRGTGAHSAAAAAAGAGPARTPYPSVHYSSSLVGTPGSCAGGDDDEDGFVLFTSQSYVRQSQPAISPSFAAGLSAGPEEEPTTTPSQDSREPRQSPSHGTTTTGSMAFDLPQPLPDEPAAAALPGPSSTSSQGRDEQEEDPHLQLTCSQLTAPSAAPGAHSAAALVGTGSTTPEDGLGLLLHGGRDLEETTTPELEQIGIVASQEGGSQQQLLGSGPGAAAAAAEAAAGGAGSGRTAHAGSTGRGRGGAAPGSSSGRGARGPGVVCEEVTAKQMLFPVFRPLKERKCVILVRHGESTYNKQDTHGKSWADPKIFDAPLTQRGRQQAVAARERVSDMLKRHGHLGSTLWLCSPLTRALETMTLAAPQVEQLAAAQQGVGAPKVVISSLIAEHCATSGDVGRPASELRGRFPGLVSAMADLQEVWWHNPAPEDNPNCALTGVFNKAESIDCMRRRVSEFASWLRHRPEHVVVAFGHSTFWKYFANSRVRLRNCEVMQMWW